MADGDLFYLGHLGNSLADVTGRSEFAAIGTFLGSLHRGPAQFAGAILDAPHTVVGLWETGFAYYHRGGGGAYGSWLAASALSGVGSLAEAY